MITTLRLTLNHRFIGLIALIVLTLSVATSLLPAQSLGINFAGRQYMIGGDKAMLLTDTDSAGVIPQANWNNVDPSAFDSGTTQQVVSPVSNTLVTAEGATTTVTFSYASQSMWAYDKEEKSGNAQLLNGYLDNTSNDEPISVTVENLAANGFTKYDIYVYYSSSDAGRIGRISDGSSTHWIKTSTLSSILTNASGGDTAEAAKSGNYVKFSSITSDSIKITLQKVITSTPENLGIAGIQIVQAKPAPAEKKAPDKTPAAETKK